MKKQKGITLTALVITIIVMLILVVVVINFALGDEGILTNAKTASAKTEEKAMLEELISMAVFDDEGKINAGETVAKAKSEYGEDNVSDITMDGKLTITGKSGTTYNYIITENGIKIGEENSSEEEDSSNIIPAGGTYIVGANLVGRTVPNSATIYNAGEEFPDLSIGGVYFYGDYVYVYGTDGYGHFFDGWAAIVMNLTESLQVEQDLTKSSYGEILESVKGMPVLWLRTNFL